VFFSEVTPANSNPGKSTYANILMGNGAGFTTLRMINNTTSDPDMCKICWDTGTMGKDGTAICQQHDDYAAQTHSARSFHNNGVNAALGDGSVRFLQDSISVQIWCCLGNGGDGMTIAIP
jgi:prepilin-type processing-associated H-X9-DG protein